MKKINNMGIVGKVFNCRIQLFKNFCHYRSQEVNENQMEVKNQNVKKVNTMGIDGKAFNCRIQLFEKFCH